MKTIPRDPPTPIVTERPAQKNIEIYATLPKNKKGGLLSRATKTKNVVEDEEYLMYDRPGRSLYSSRSKLNGKKEPEKRARSEERNNKNIKEKEFVSNSLSKEAKKSAKTEEAKQGKKQHKIRRKLLMGGLIRRKNRSMPDLREDEIIPKGTTKDDSSLASKAEKQPGLSGYLSEGHLEFSGNPNLERSKLMRKSLHGSKLLHMAKVPPPPPIRTTSQLSKSDRPQFPLPMDGLMKGRINDWTHEPQSLPYIPANYTECNRVESVTYANGGFLLPGHQQPNKLITTAQVHQEQSPQNGKDEVDFLIDTDLNGFPLPPYPSPLNSVSHSRQPSEDFPPPPPPIADDIQADGKSDFFMPGNLLIQVQQKRQQILAENEVKEANEAYEAARSIGGETWLRELQAKQAALKGKKLPITSSVTQNLIQRNNLHQNLSYQNNVQHNYIQQISAQPQCSPYSNGMQQNFSAQNGVQQSSYMQNKVENHSLGQTRIQTPTRCVETNGSPEIKERINSPMTSEEILASQQSTSVKDLKSRFEQIKLNKHVDLEAKISRPIRSSPTLSDNSSQSSNFETQLNKINKPIRASPTLSDNSTNFDPQLNINPIKTDPVSSLTNSNTEKSEIDCNKLNGNDVKHLIGVISKQHFDNNESRRKSGKKKNVTFCEQVVLVATADDEEDDSYIPNPILERVLRSVLHKDSPQQECRETAVQSIVPLKRTDSGCYESTRPHQEPVTARSCDAVDGIRESKINSNIGSEQNVYQQPIQNHSSNTGSLSDLRTNSLPANNVEPTPSNHQLNLQRHYVPQQQRTNPHQPSPVFNRQVQNQIQTSTQVGSSHSLNFHNTSPNFQIYNGQYLQSQPPQSLQHYQDQPTHPESVHYNQSEYQSIQYQQNNSQQPMSPTIQMSSLPYHAIKTDYQPQQITNPQGYYQYRNQHPNQPQVHQQPTMNQQSPMLNRQPNHVPISFQSQEIRKINAPNQTIQHFGRVPENHSITHPPLEGRLSNSSSNLYHHQLTHQNPNVQQRTIQNQADQNARFVHNPVVGQHNVIRTRPHAMYQQDLSPPEYNHPPPPNKVPNNMYSTRADCQRIPNNHTNVEQFNQISSVQSNPSQNYPPTSSSYNHQNSTVPTNSNNHQQLNSHQTYHHLQPQYPHQNNVTLHGTNPNQYQTIQNHTSQQYQHQPNPSHGAQQFQHQVSSNHSPTQSNHQYHQQYPSTVAQPVKYPPYQHPPPPKQAEPSNKLTERAVQPAGMVHVRGNPCNLCRKKQVTLPAVYCSDCDFYMSRFKPKT